MSKLLSKLNGSSLLRVLLPIIFIPVILYNTTLVMVHVWTVNETFTPGFLVLFLLGWLISAVLDVKIVQQFSMITIIMTSTWVITGRQILFYVFIPLLFLYFAVPFVFYDAKKIAR